MKRFILFFSLLITVSVVFGQNTERVSLSEKWSKIMDKAYVSGAYKSFKTVELEAFWRQTADSLAYYKKEASAGIPLLQQQRDSVSVVKKQLAEVSAQLQEVQSDKDSISYLGITTNKYAYLSILFLITLGLIGLVGFVFFKYKNSHVVTAQKIEDYEHLYSEFEEYKKGKIEMERKLKRELQTCLNKLDDLKR